MVDDDRVVGQDASRTVQAVTNQDEEEALESAGPSHLQSQQVVVGQHLDLVTLTAALSNAPAVAKEPTP